MKFNTSFEKFANEYDNAMGDNGDYTHLKTITPALFDLIKNPKGFKIYDVGCGNGYIARRLVREGAKEVFASDISETMIHIAKSRYPIHSIIYSIRDMSDFSGFKEGYFDLVVMNMSISYSSNIKKLAKEIARILKTGGRFVFTLDHPLKYSAYKVFGRTDFDITLKDSDYLNEKEETTYNHWTKQQNALRIYTRPLGSYINALGEYGLFVKFIREPQSKAEYKDKKVKTSIPFKIAVEVVKVV